jgi:hypothetical protein
MKSALRRRALHAALLLLVPLGAACDGLLDVDTSGILTPDDLEGSGPASIAPMVFGVVGNYQEAVDGIVEYGAVMTDEMIASGPFGSRLQVDARFIQPQNFELTAAVYLPLHQARHLADTTALILQQRLQDADYASVVGDILAGMSLSKLYGGYSRVWLAELYCWSILTGVTPEPAPLLPDARMRQALQLLRETEAQALVAGYADVRLAALVGQARAHLWLREYEQAAAIAARVPRAFVYNAEYSQNSVTQYNEVYATTWGDAAAVASTVGSGEVLGRGNERFEHFDQFVALNLIVVRPGGIVAETASIPVMLQTLYKRQDSDIMIASGVEAILIRAEAAVRGGRTAEATQLLNDLRADYSLRVALSSKVDLPAPEDQLEPLALTGNVRSDLKTIADERARELWLTGDRFVTSRRFRRDSFGIDLFPPVKTTLGGADDTAFPIAQRELDANPNLSPGQACPPGQTIGSWR